MASNILRGHSGQFLVAFNLYCPNAIGDQFCTFNQCIANSFEILGIVVKIMKWEPNVKEIPLDTQIKQTQTTTQCGKTLIEM